jgi:hypothetical protein
VADILEDRGLTEESRAAFARYSSDWANLLARLLEDTIPRAYLIKDKLSVIGRPNVLANSEGHSGSSYGNGIETGGYSPAANGYLDDFGPVRRVLARLMSIEELERLRTNEDIALRCGFYRYGFPDRTTMKKAYEREPKFFLNNALYNDSIWRERELRETLRDLCWADTDPDFRYPNSYDNRMASMSADHPEWFKDTSALEPPDHTLADVLNIANNLITQQMELKGRIDRFHRQASIILWVLAILFATLLLRRL